MTCWYCNGKMVWQSDFNFEDYGREGEGIVTILTCSECEARAEFSSKPEEEKGDWIIKDAIS